MVLILVALISFMPRVYVGIHRQIDYDSFWHVFIASQTVFSEFVREIRLNAHPPLFYLLLKPVAAVAPVRLGYRFVSIAASAGSVYLIGRILLLATRNAWGAIAAALVFALSWNSVVMSTEVRSYSLLVGLLLGGTWAFLHWLQEGRRAWLIGLLFSLAVLSHYSGILYFLALLAAVALTDRSSWPRLRRAAVELLTPIVVYAIMYRLHASAWTVALNHLPTHYFDSKVESVRAFLLRNVRLEIETFIPRFVPIWAGVVALALYLVALARVWWKGDRMSAILGLCPVILAGGLIATSLLGKYPFGGQMRQQFFLYTAFIVGAIALGGSIIKSAARNVLAAVLVVAGTTAAFSQEWSRFHPVPHEMGARKMELIRQNFPGAEAIYTAQYDLIFLYSGLHNWRWEYLMTSPDSIVRDYLLDSPGARMLVFRDFRWLPDLSDPGFYTTLQQTLQRSSGRIIVAVQRNERDPAPQAEERIRNAASGAKVKIGKVVVDNEHVVFEVTPL